MNKNVPKRIADILISALLLLIASPVILIIAIILYIFNSGEVFFVQQRPGENGKAFKIIKFKTMTDEKYKNGRELEEYERITKTGKTIRDYSLDELLQLINVLKGDMSLIGPRPLLEQYLHLYNERQKKRHKVKPGITGWAQVNGRNATTWDERFEQDVWYVENISFKLDMKIFFLTILKIFKKEGVNMDDNTTMTFWKGNS